MLIYNYRRTSSNREKNKLSSFTSDVTQQLQIESFMSEHKLKSIGLLAFNFTDRKFTCKQAKREKQ